LQTAAILFKSYCSKTGLCVYDSADIQH